MEYHRSPQSELFDLLDRLQSARLDDQRCELPSAFNYPSHTVSDSRQTSSKDMLQRILKHPPPYPMIALVKQASYWTETHENPQPHHSRHRTRDSRLMINGGPTLDEDSARLYRVHFAGFEHFNFCASDENGQSLVLSIKVNSTGIGGAEAGDENNNCQETEDDEETASRNVVRVILRSIDKTVHQVMRLSDLIPNHSDPQASSSPNLPPGLIIQQQPSAVIESVMSHFAMPPSMPVMFPGISDAITSFDEHGISNTFKFGVIYQRFGQVTEEALFNNKAHSPAMEEFLQLLGQRVRLSKHTGYRGGLDTRHGQTGSHALYEKFQGNEIMFHVSTLLPFVESDEQQLQRKCHIGNDIVSIVFQEVNTPFSPDMIASHFLHAYIVVQPIDPCTSITRYRVSIVAQKDVPPFGPPLPQCAIFDKGLAFKDFLLAKLVNGERACHHAHKFQTLHQRTRATLLVNLAKELREQTVEYINANYTSSLSSAFKDSKSPSPSSSRLFTSVKRALKHVGSTKHELNRHVSAGSLSEAMLSTASTAERKTSNHSTVGTVTSEDSVKADSGHGDSDGSLPSSPPLANCRKKLLSTSQPHLAVLNDHHLIDTSSVEADDIIYERRNHHRVGLHHHHHSHSHQLRSGQVGPTLNVTPLTLIEKKSATATQNPGVTSSSTHHLPSLPQKKPKMNTSVTVISGAVTTIPVGGSPTDSGSSTTSSTSSTSSLGPSGSLASNSPPLPPAGVNNASVSRLHQDISRLRVDKLELLRQALSAQHEVRQLRQREAQLETDLALAAAEIRRLKNQLKGANQSEADSPQNQQQANPVSGVAPRDSRPRRTVQMHIPL